MSTISITKNDFYNQKRVKKDDGVCKLVFISPNLSEILKQIPRNSEYIIDVDNKHRNPETFRKVWNQIKSITEIYAQLVDKNKTKVIGFLPESFND